MKKESKGWSLQKIKSIIITVYVVVFFLIYRHFPTVHIGRTIDLMVALGILGCVAVCLIIARREKAREEDQDEDEDG